MITALKKTVALLGLLLVLSGHAVADDVTRGLTNETVQSTFGEHCGIARQCGALSLIDCNSAGDGPAYYVRTATLEIVMRCGGYCLAPLEDLKGDQCSECPPKEWTCER